MSLSLTALRPTLRLGRTTVAASQDSNLVDYVVVTKATAATSGVVSWITAWMSGTASPAKFKLVLYASSGGLPSTALGYTAEYTLGANATAAWVPVQLLVPVVIVAGTMYFVGFFFGDGNGHQFYSSGSGDSTSEVNWHPAGSYAAGVPPAFTPGSFGNGPFRYSVYAGEAPPLAVLAAGTPLSLNPA